MGRREYSEEFRRDAVKQVVENVYESFILSFI